MTEEWKVVFVFNTEEWKVAIVFNYRILDSIYRRTWTCVCVCVRVHICVYVTSVYIKQGHRTHRRCSKRELFMFNYLVYMCHKYSIRSQGLYSFTTLFFRSRLFSPLTPVYGPNRSNSRVTS